MTKFFLFQPFWKKRQFNKYNFFFKINIKLTIKLTRKKTLTLIMQTDIKQQIILSMKLFLNEPMIRLLDVKCKIGNRAKGIWIDWIILHQKFKLSSELYDDIVTITHGIIEMERVMIIRIHRLTLIFVKPFIENIWTNLI